MIDLREAQQGISVREVSEDVLGRRRRRGQVGERPLTSRHFVFCCVPGVAWGPLERGRARARPRAPAHRPICEMAPTRCTKCGTTQAEQYGCTNAGLMCHRCTAIELAGANFALHPNCPPLPSDLIEKITSAFCAVMASAPLPMEARDHWNEVLTRCASDSERGVKMKNMIDRMFTRSDTFCFAVRGLVARPDLNDCPVEVLGPSRHGAEGSLRFPVRVLNCGAEMLLKPQNLMVRLHDDEKAAAEQEEHDEEGKEEEEEDNEEEEEGDEDEASAQESSDEQEQDDDVGFYNPGGPLPVSDAEILSALREGEHPSPPSVVRVKQTLRRGMWIAQHFYYGPNGPHGLEHSLGKRVGYMQRTFGDDSNEGRLRILWWLQMIVGSGSPDDVCPHTGKAVHLVKCRTIQQMIEWVRTGWSPRSGPLPAHLARRLLPPHIHGC